MRKCKVHNETGRVPHRLSHKMNICGLQFQKKYVLLYGKPEVLRSDNGKEFRNSTIDQFCTERNIKRRYTTRYSPQQNGIVEVENRILIQNDKVIEEMILRLNGQTKVVLEVGK